MRIKNKIKEYNKMAKKGFWTEFKEFITKGNVVDMAIGVVVGGAFKDIVNSLVANIITPAISLLTGKSSFEELVWVLKEGVPAELAEDGVTELVPAVLPVELQYGIFIQKIIDFIIIALTIFVVLKVFTGLQHRSEVIRQKLDAEKYEAEQKKAAEEAAAKAEAEAAAAEALAAEKADIEAARKAQKETAALLSDIKELLAKK